MSHGLRVGPNSTGSQAGAIPNSGVLVLPRMTRPARRSRSTSSESKADTLPARKREPSVKRTPSISQARSLSRYGTPANGPAGSGPRRLGRPLEDRRDHGVQHRVQRLDPLDGRRDQLGRADLAGADQLGLGGGVEQRQVLAHGRTACRDVGDLDVAETADPRRGQPRLGDRAEEHLAPGELLVDLPGRAGVEHRQPGVRGDAQVHVERVESEFFQHPAGSAGRSSPGSPSKYTAPRYSGSAHGRASSTMLNGAASAATRRTPGVAGVGEHLAEPGLARHGPERGRAGLGERGGRAHQRRDRVADAGVRVGEIVLEAVGGERLDDHHGPAGRQGRAGMRGGGHRVAEVVQGVGEA